MVVRVCVQVNRCYFWPCCDMFSAAFCPSKGSCSALYAEKLPVDGSESMGSSCRSWTPCLATRMRDAGNSCIASVSLRNLSASCWTDWNWEIQAMKWEEYVPKHLPLSGNLHIIAFITSKNTREPVTRWRMLASIFFNFPYLSDQVCMFIIVSPMVDCFELDKDEFKKGGKNFVSSNLWFKMTFFYLLLWVGCSYRNIKSPSAWIRPLHVEANLCSSTSVINPKMV